MTEFNEQYFRDLAPRQQRFDTPVSDQLVFCIFPNGIKSWVYLYEVDGYTRRRTIGLFPDMSYEAALHALDPNRRIAELDASQQRRPAAKSKLPGFLSGISTRDVLTAGGTAVVALTAFMLLGGPDEKAPTEPAAADAGTPAADAMVAPTQAPAETDEGSLPDTATVASDPAPTAGATSDEAAGQDDSAASLASAPQDTVPVADGEAPLPAEADATAPEPPDSVIADAADDTADDAADDAAETTATAAAALSEPPPGSDDAGKTTTPPADEPVQAVDTETPAATPEGDQPPDAGAPGPADEAITELADEATRAAQDTSVQAADESTTALTTAPDEDLPETVSAALDAPDAEPPAEDIRETDAQAADTQDPDAPVAATAAADSPDADTPATDTAAAAAGDADTEDGDTPGTETAAAGDADTPAGDTPVVDTQTADGDADTPVVDTQTAAGDADTPAGDTPVVETPIAAAPDTDPPAASGPDAARAEEAAVGDSAGTDADTAEADPADADIEASPPAEAATENTAGDETAAARAGAEPATASGIGAATAAGFVQRAVLAADVVDLEPEGLLTEMVPVPAGGDRLLYFFTELRKSAGQTVVHRWLNEGRIVAEREFEVRDDWRWRVYSARRIGADETGGWRVEALTPGGQLLASTNFVVEVTVEPTATAALSEEAIAE